MDKPPKQRGLAMLLNAFSIRASDKELATAVRIALLETLFSSRLSLVVGAVLGSLTAALVVYITPSPWLMGCGILLTLSGIGRVASFGLFRPGSSNAGSLKWEIIYQFGALSYALLLGQLTFLTIAISDDLRLHLLTAALSTGYAAGAAGRNTGRPVIAIGQLIVCALPLSIALLFEPSLPNGLLAVANILYIAVMIDITLRTYKTVLEAFIDRQEKLRLATVYERLSKTDPLTGIANRTTLKSNLEALMTEGTPAIAVIWIDLDRFKQINDTLGHAAGDAVLHAVAERLSKLVDKKGIIARFGGDEFIVVTPVADTDIGLDLGETIRRQLSKPVKADDLIIDVSASIGLSISTPDLSADDLLRHADVALYEAKAKGRNCVELFDPEMETRLLSNKQLEHDLRRAIANDELELYYQPIVDLMTGQVRGFEALLRWHHPTEGNVPPSLFIPIAENSHLIGSITEWVLKNACATACLWPDDIAVSVNISPPLLKARELPPMIYGALLESGLQPRRLNLEITETALVEDNPNVSIVLEGFQKLGIHLSLDDFGTGYSSLSYLCRYKFDAIKIDRSFIGNIHRTSGARAVIQAISGLARSLNLTIVAEGIETADQLDYVCAQGCSTGQGYYFARPMPMDRIAEYLKAAPFDISAMREAPEDTAVPLRTPSPAVAKQAWSA